jgi:hypothetical protein
MEKQLTLIDDPLWDETLEIWPEGLIATIVIHKSF